VYASECANRGAEQAPVGVHVGVLLFSPQPPARALSSVKYKLRRRRLRQPIYHCTHSLAVLNRRRTSESRRSVAFKISDIHLFNENL